MPVTTEQREIVLKALENGDSLVKACQQASIPSRRHWYEAMDAEAPLSDSYARARQRGYEARADRLIDDAWDMSIDPQHKRLILDTQKWELSKMLPKYSDKLDLSATVQASVTLVTTPTDEAL